MYKRQQDDVVTRNTVKCSGNVTENKVSTDNCNNELKSDNEIIKNVLESKVTDNSGDAVLVERESSNKIVVKERLSLQRANFSHDLNGEKTPIMSYEDRVSSRNYVRDKVSLNRSPVMYHEFPERIRMGYDLSLIHI